MAASEHVGVEELLPLSLENYHRLVEAGAFEDERVELLEGLLVRMSPRTPRHERAIRWLSRWLHDATDAEQYDIGVAASLTLAGSEPEPDLAVIERGTPEPYHPGGAALVIEVAVSSLTRDLAVKAALYATAAIPEYWVLDLDGHRLICHRDPRAEGYAHRFEVPAGGQLTAASLALPTLRLDELLAAAGSD